MRWALIAVLLSGCAVAAYQRNVRADGTVECHSAAPAIVDVSIATGAIFGGLFLATYFAGEPNRGDTPLNLGNPGGTLLALFGTGVVAGSFGASASYGYRHMTPCTPRDAPPGNAASAVAP